MGGTRRYAWIAFWIISAHYLIGNFHRVCPAVVAPELISAFGISGASLGILASTYLNLLTMSWIPGIPRIRCRCSSLKFWTRPRRVFPTRIVKMYSSWPGDVTVG